MRAEQSRAEQSRAEQSRAEQSRRDFRLLISRGCNITIKRVSMWKIYQSVACLSICTRIISII